MTSDSDKNHLTHWMQQLYIYHTDRRGIVLLLKSVSDFKKGAKIFLKYSTEALI